MKSTLLKAAVATAMVAGLSGLAFPAEPAPQGGGAVALAPQPPQAMEILEISKAKGGMMDEAAGAGGYSLVSRTNAMGMMGKLTINTNARFQKSGATPKDDPETLLKTKCSTKASVTTPLWNGAFGVTMETRQFSNVYACTFEGQDPAAYNFEIAMPPDKSSAVTPGGIMTVQVQRNKAGDYANAYLARLMYNGKAYSAQPVGLDPKKYDTRMMRGFSFTRDGTEIGGVTFVGGARDKGSITAPTAGSGDREAVIFLALALLHMPDASSRIVQSLKYAPH